MAVEVVPPTKWTRKKADNADLTFIAETGHRHTLLDVLAYNFPAKTSVDVNAGGKYLARIYTDYGDLKLAQPPGGAVLPALAFLKAAIPDFPLPYAAHDEALILEPANKAAGRIVHGYFYDEIVPDPAVKTLAGGSQATIIPLTAWITHSAAISASGLLGFDTPLAPTGYDEFKNGMFVPGNKRYHVAALAFGAAKNVGTKFTVLHIWDEGTELLSEEHEGLQVDIDEGNELLLDVTAEKIFKLRDLYAFAPNHKITLNAYGLYDGTNTLAAQSCALGLLGWIEVLAS